MNSLKIESKDVSLICRACLSSEHLKPSFASHLYVIYEKITELKVDTNDNLPQNICTACSNKLEDISNFIQICKLSDKYLKTLSNNVVLKDENYTSNEIEDSSDDNKEDIILNEKEIVATSKDSIDSLHDITKKSSCQTCGENFFQYKDLEHHKKIHSEAKLFECRGCDKKFSKKSLLWSHFSTHTGVKPFGCNLCGKEVKTKIQILEHVRKNHSHISQEDYGTVINRQDDSLFNYETYRATIPLIDPKIEIEFNDTDPVLETNHNLLNTELKLSDNAKTDLQGTIDYQKKPLDANKLVSQKEPNTELPESDSEATESLLEESSVPAKKKRLEHCLCSLCGKQFKRNEYLRNHMATHMNIKPYTCSVCGMGFTQRQALSRHNLVHTKERPHKCTYCEKTFTRKEKLTDHIRCHEEGVPPHLCFHCGRRFKDREYLRKHLHYHLMGGKNRWKSESKKCLCPECGKEFHSESYLKKHLGFHTGEKPFTCEICNKCFSVSAGLDYHMKIHKGIRPFKCTHSQCNKAFRTNYALKVHEKMHGSERPFQCIICNKGFVRNSHLKRHLKLHEDNLESLPVNT